MSLRLSREARSKREQIEEACRTSTDDVGIARYFHVPAYEVQEIRLAMVERDAGLPVASPCAVAAASDELRDRRRPHCRADRPPARGGGGMTRKVKTKRERLIERHECEQYELLRRVLREASEPEWYPA